MGRGISASSSISLWLNISLISTYIFLYYTKVFYKFVQSLLASDKSRCTPHGSCEFSKNFTAVSMWDTVDQLHTFS